MGGNSVNALLLYIRRLVAAHEAAGQTDEYLLERFVSRRDESAFAALLERHAPMTLGVCLRILRDEHLAEDAFQATFLVLALKAGTIRKRGSVASWLYGAALRLARKAKAESYRAEQALGQTKSRSVSTGLNEEASCREEREILDEELGRLPDKYRLPLLLCYCEGRTQNEAAAQLGWTPGKVRGLLERGRQRLRSRMIRRGVTLPSATLGTASATLLVDGALSAAVPPLLAASTVKAAVEVVSGKTLAECGVSAAVASLIKGGLIVGSKKTMLILTLVLLAGAVALGAGMWGRSEQDPPPRPDAAPIFAARDAAGEKEKPVHRAGLSSEFVLQAGHTDGVRGVALSGDGKYLVTSSFDKTAILWDAAGGKRLRTFHGHTDAVETVVMSADGKHFVTGASDGAILWETVSGKRLRTFRGHTLPNTHITSVALSRDGKRLVTGSYDKTAIVWDTASGEKFQTLTGHTEFVTGVAFNGDGTLVATGSYDGTAALWEVDRGKKLQTYSAGVVGKIEEMRGGSFMCVALSGDGKQLVTAFHMGGKSLADPPDDRIEIIKDSTREDKRKQIRQDDSGGKTAILWDAVSGKKLRTFEGHADFIPSVVLSDDGKRLLTGSYDKTAILWDVASGERLKTFEGGTGRIYSVALSSDGTHVAAGSDSERTASVWNVASGKRLQNSSGNNVAVRSLALSGDGKRIAIGSEDKTVVLWDVAAGKSLQTFVGHTATVWGLALNRDGSRVLSGSPNGPAILWDAARGKILHTFDCVLGLGVALSADGKHAVTAAGNKAIVWETAGGKMIQTLQEKAGGESIVSRVALSDDGNVALTLSGSFVTLWQADGGKILKTFRVVKEGPPFILEDRPLMPIIEPGAVNGAKAEKAFEGHTREVSCVALSGNGKYVVTAALDDTTILWNAASGKKLQTFKGPIEMVLSVALSGDGKLVAGSSYDKTAFLWDEANGQILQIFRGHTAGVEHVALSGDGKQVWTASFDGSTRLWDPDTGKERCRLYSINAGKDWLVVTPEGLFDGSEGAWRFVTYRTPETLTLIDDDATRRRFHRPGLLAQVWQGK